MESRSYRQAVHNRPVRASRRLLVALVLLVATAYTGVLIWFHLNENTLLFHPDRTRLADPPASLGLDSRDVPIRGRDGTQLMARLIPPPTGSRAATAKWILYLHGAGGNVGTLAYNRAWARFRQLGLGVLAIDYRGYGQSAGTPEESGLYADAEAAYRYLGEDLGIPPARIFIYGYSLGSAVAIDLATRVPAAGLIVEGAFTSVPARAAELYPWLPIGWLAHNRFASAEKIGRVSIPKLFIHARADTVVPIAHGRRLFDLARPPKLFRDVAGGHTNAFEKDPAFFGAVADFIAGLPSP